MMLDTLQREVRKWMLACFGADIADDKRERNYRFLEEALELVQAGGCTKAKALQLVDYTYSRPPGVIAQEVGGVAVTLSALCDAWYIDLDYCASQEVKRVWFMIDQIRAKQAGKPRNSNLPLPTVAHVRWYLSVPTMDADPLWHRAHITEALPGGRANVLLDTPDGRQVPLYSVSQHDLRYEPPPGARTVSYSNV